LEDEMGGILGEVQNDKGTKGRKVKVGE
jgi:hypothetical protein